MAYPLQPITSQFSQGILQVGERIFTRRRSRQGLAAALVLTHGKHVGVHTGLIKSSFEIAQLCTDTDRRNFSGRAHPDLAAAAVEKPERPVVDGVCVIRRSEILENQNFLYNTNLERNLRGRPEIT